MASMRDIKRRKVSVQSTQQITKAMKLVSTVKLQRARATAERSKRYFDSKGLRKLPSHKALQTEIEQHIKEKNELYNQYQTAKEEAQRLDTIRHNLEQTLGRKIERKQEQER